MRTAETRATSDEHEQETHELKWQTQRARRPRSRKNTKWCLLSCEFPSEIFAIHTHTNTQKLKHTNYTHPIQPQCGHTGKHKQGTLTYIHAKINSIHPTKHTHTYSLMYICACTDAERKRKSKRESKKEREKNGWAAPTQNFARHFLCIAQQKTVMPLFAGVAACCLSEKSAAQRLCMCVYVCVCVPCVP